MDSKLRGNPNPVSNKTSTLSRRQNAVGVNFDLMTCSNSIQQYFFLLKFEYLFDQPDIHVGITYMDSIRIFSVKYIIWFKFWDMDNWICIVHGVDSK